MIQSLPANKVIITPPKPGQYVYHNAISLKKLDGDVFQRTTQPEVSFEGKKKQAEHEIPMLFDYIVTNRGYETFKNWYPAEAFEGLEGKKVLDIGCGGGKFVKQLDAQGIDIIGIDKADPWNSYDAPDGENIQIDQNDVARGLFKYADAANIPFDDESFDVIFSSLSVFFDKYEFAPFMIEAMKEAKRVLTDGGKIYLFGHNNKMEDIVDKVGGLKLERIDDERFVLTKTNEVQPAIKPENPSTEKGMLYKLVAFFLPKSSVA